MSRTLTDTQLVILSTAASREDRNVLPVPDSIKVKGKKLDAILHKLIKLNLIEPKPVGPNIIGPNLSGSNPVTERSVRLEGTIWGEDEENPMIPVITASGLDAIGVVPDGGKGGALKTLKNQPAGPRSAKGHQPSKKTAGNTRTGTKKALVIGLLSRKTGATIADLCRATSWQPHTCRAALTRLRQAGYAINRHLDGDLDGDRNLQHGKARGAIYRITRAREAVK